MSYDKQRVVCRASHIACMRICVFSVTILKFMTPPERTGGMTVPRADDKSVLPITIKITRRNNIRRVIRFLLRVKHVFN